MRMAVLQKLNINSDDPPRDGPKPSAIIKPGD